MNDFGKCPDCGLTISLNEEICPYCGKGFKVKNQNRSNSEKKKR